MDKTRQVEPFGGEVLIIGAGLTGLTLAYRLAEQGVSLHIVEARDRPGGRILTRYAEAGAPVEMGATWFGHKHRHLRALLQELELAAFPQYLGQRAIYEPMSTSPPQLISLPPNDQPSYRIQGGTMQLIEKLQQAIPGRQLHYGQIVERIWEDQDQLLVQTNRQTFKVGRVVSTLPPYLLQHAVAIEPALPPETSAVLAQTHTWMGTSIKIGLRYAEPFWRKPRTSGTVFSNVGPLTELYDHSDYEQQYYALKGFLKDPYHSLSKAERQVLVLQQLAKYYGAVATNVLAYEELVWRQETFTFADYTSDLLPHQHNGHPVYRRPYLNGRLYVAGSETAAHFPGYMDGAVASADWVYHQLLAAD